MTRPRLLDLFCGAGGAGMGYHRAGFDVVGVDVKPQPHYPFEFVQADAMQVLTYLVDRAEPWTGAPRFDAIHASPPCQRYSASTPDRTRSTHPDLVEAVRHFLKPIGLPWVMENVPRSPLRADYKLCGCMFGLPNLKRERWFETSWGGFSLRQPCEHSEPVYSVCGDSAVKSHVRGSHRPTFADWRRCMGIEWMTGREMSQAIPPAYTEYIGRQLFDAITQAAVS